MANFDHLGISLQVKSNIQTHVCVNKRVIWRYTHTEFDRGCELIDMLDMDNIIDSNSVEKSWSNWKRAFMSIMEECVPKQGRKNMFLDGRTDLVGGPTITSAITGGVALSINMGSFSPPSLLASYASAKVV